MQLVGKIVSFVYAGGSEPDTLRYAYVFEEHNAYLDCQDLEKGEFRRFSLSKITSLKALNENKYNSIDVSFLSAPELVFEDLLEQGKWAVYDKNTRRVVWVDPVERKEHRADNKIHSFVTPNMLGIFFPLDNQKVRDQVLDLIDDSGLSNMVTYYRFDDRVELDNLVKQTF